MTLPGLEVEETWICPDPVEAKPQALAVDPKRVEHHTQVLWLT